MRRFRKGDKFRPPTAAESAANADALEGFRRRSPVPQDLAPVGQDIVVKTPEAGIDARVGTTISSAVCTRSIEVDGASSTKTLVDTDEELVVYNLETASVPGEIYVHTGMAATGTRYVKRGSTGWEWGKLDGALAASGTATMSVWRDDPLADTTDNITVSAPPLLLSGSLASGSWVWAQLHSNGLWYVMGGEC